MNNKSHMLKGIAALAAFSLSVPAIYAQSSRGAITGNVVDNSGAKVAGTVVTLTSPSTGVVVTATTNQEGIYRFDALIPGDYVVSIALTGFNKEEQAATVVVGANVGRDFTLHPGSTDTVVVEAGAAAELQTEDAVRGGVLPAVALAELPIPGQNSLNLMLTIPGVARTNTGSNDTSGVGSVNGARGRSNNFLIDGLQNNDISVAGPQFTITNNDELQEVSIQTSNFTAEYGRAGGAVVNQITKNGTNSLHGTLATVYRTQLFNASTWAQRINFNNGSTSVLKNKFHENIPAFTIGGPVYIPHIYNGHDKTFFFAAGQWDRYSANAAGTTFTIPTAAGYATLAALAPKCPNVAKYLTSLGDARGSAGTGSALQDISVPANLASTTCDGTARTGQFLQTGNYVRTVPEVSLDNNHLVRIDHHASDKQNLMFRWLYDKTSDNIGGTVGINPNFDVPFTGRTMGANFNHTYQFAPTVLNEFRFGFVRNLYTFFNKPGIADQLPTYSATGLTSLNLSSTFPQGRISNNFQYQDTVSVVRGKHAMKFGVEFLRQLATQQAPYNSRGAYTYNAIGATPSAGVATPITAIANFIDDTAGLNGAAAISLGSGRYHPNLFTWTLYAQDIWKATPDLTLTYGLRYENFGQPANKFTYPAFVGTGDTDITNPAKVNNDNNNFGPTVGFSYNPHSYGFKGSTVIRGGYQVTYDTQFNNILSNLVAGVPNTIANASVVSPITTATPRGYRNLTGFPFTASAVTPYTSEANKVRQDLHNPYYHHFSLGIQQQLPGKIVLDVSYVGSQGRQLYYTHNYNPQVPNSTFTSTDTQVTTLYGTQNKRYFPNRGSIQIRDQGVTSSYNSLQVQVRRRQMQTMLGQLNFSTSYTYSKALDTIGDIFATLGSGAAVPSRSTVYGPIGYVDRGPSDTDLRHISSTLIQLNVRGVKNHFLNEFVGGWTVAPILFLQSGQPYTVLNGADRDLDGLLSADRPDIGNPSKPVYTRGIVTPKVAGGSVPITSVCATGYYNGAATINAQSNPISANCVSPNDVHFLQVTTYSLPNQNTEARNSNYTTRYLDLDLNLLKKVSITERVKAELRFEGFNVTNNANFTTPLPVATYSTVTNLNGANFQNFLASNTTTNGGGRTFRVGAKILF